MSNGMYVIQDSAELVALAEQPYDSEDFLQRLLEDHPGLLAGDQIDPASPRRWLLAKREVAIADAEGGGGRWWLDHLFLDQDGIPTLVEVKRSTDTRARREVVGQMLDYAVNALRCWSVEYIRGAFEETCAQKGKSPAAVLHEFLDPDADPEAYWQQVKTNLQAGRLRLLFVADAIPTELRRVVEFLNAQMDPAEVLAVEIRQFAGESLRILVPRVVGHTGEAERLKGTTRRPARQWDERSFLDELTRKVGPEQVRVARGILEWAAQQGLSVSWGRGSTGGTFTVFLQVANTRHTVCCVHTGWGSTPPGIETQFQYQAGKPPFDDENRRRELLRRFNEIPGVELPADSIDRRPSIPLGSFVTPESFEALLSVFSWCVAQVRST